MKKQNTYQNGINNLALNITLGHPANKEFLVFVSSFMSIDLDYLKWRWCCCLDVDLTWSYNEHYSLHSDYSWLLPWWNNKASERVKPDKKKKNSSLPLCFGTNIFELHLIMTFCEQVYFAVHSRVIPPHASIFKVYDLKGSWKGWKVNKSKVVENIILRDMDSGFCFFLDPLTRE